jgi:hypothetical protein
MDAVIATYRRTAKHATYAEICLAFWRRDWQADAIDEGAVRFGALIAWHGACLRFTDLARRLPCACYLPLPQLV